jgi:hypothetical protein
MLLSAFLALCPCSPQESAPAAAGESVPASRPLPTFVFRWPKGSRGRVKEAQSIDGVDLAMSAHIELMPLEGGASLLERSDPRIESYRGYGPTHPFVIKMITRLEEASPLQPTFAIGPAGEWRGLTNYAQIAAELVARQVEAGLAPAEESQALERLLDPAEQARAERQVRVQWNAWCLNWLDMPLQVAWSETRDLLLDLPSGKQGRTGTVERRVRGLETRAGVPCWHVSRFEQRSGPWFFKHFGGQLPQLLPGLELSRVRACTLLDQTEAWLDADSLRPLEVQRRYTLRADLEPSDSQQEVETRKTQTLTTWTFDWEAPAK